MAKPISSAAQSKLLPNTPLSAVTLAGELTQKAIFDLKKKIIPWIKDRRGKPPCLAYAVTVGVGKTAAIVQVVRQALKHGSRVAIRTPTLELGRELFGRLEKVVPGGVGLWYGREQPDPRSQEHKMCRRSDDVRAAQFVGGSPKDVCGSKKRGYCAFHPDGGSGVPCGYMSQILGYKQGVIFAGDAMLELAPREGMKRAKEWRPYKRLTVPAPDLFSRDIVKLDNATAFVHEPKPIGSAKDKPDFDLLILDETDPLSMLAGFDVPPVSLTREAYEAIMATFKDPSDQEIVSGFLTLFQEACSDAGVGGFLPPLKPGEYYHDLGQDQLSGLNLDEEIGIFRSEFITGDYIEMLETVREIAFENLPKPVNQNAFIKLTAKQIIEANAVTIKARSLLLGVARVCEVMCLGLRNDLSILRHLKVSTTAGSILLRRKKTLGHHYSRLPTMIFDATLRPELLQQTFERLEIAYQQYATDSGGVLRYQLRDRDLSYGTLEGADWLPRLWLFSRLCNRMHGPTGLITPKSIRDQLPEDAHAGVRLGHFGALRGLNAFENVAALVVASRTAVAPGRAEDMAAVLSGQNISALPAEETWYPAKKGLIRWRQDPRAGWSTKYVEHPDPMVESVRAAITEDGLEQALGRGRNVRRSRGRPLVEYIITTTPTNRPVDGTFSMTELKAATGWIGAFLELGVWFKGGTKGVGGVLHTIARALAAQRPDSLYISLIGNPAFEGPETASDWRKKQIDDNPEISRLSNEIDKALGSRGKSVEVMCSLYPLHDFAPVEAKVKGSRYFAQLYVRIGEGQTAIDAMNALLGPLVGELEIRPAPMA